jgi:hypothetical protein
MEPGSKFGSLFKRELFDGGLDLVDAHGLNDIQKCLSRQRAKVTTEAERSEDRGRRQRTEKRNQTSNIKDNHGSDVIAGFFKLIQGCVDLDSVKAD